MRPPSRTTNGHSAGFARKTTLSQAFTGPANEVNVESGGQALPVTITQEESRVLIKFANKVVLDAGQQIRVSLL